MSILQDLSIDWWMDGLNDIAKNFFSPSLTKFRKIFPNWPSRSCFQSSNNAARATRSCWCNWRISGIFAKIMLIFASLMIGGEHFFRGSRYSLKKTPQKITLITTTTKNNNKKTYNALINSPNQSKISGNKHFYPFMIEWTTSQKNTQMDLKWM